MITKEVESLLQKQIVTLLDSTPTGVVVISYPDCDWEISTSKILFSNSAAMRMSPLEATNRWDELPESSLTSLRGHLLLIKQAVERGEEGFIGPFAQTSLDADGNTIHLEYRETYLGQTQAEGIVTLVVVQDVTDRVFRERVRLREQGGAASPDQRLTDRERAIALLIVEGFGTKQIADQLGISTRTVENHRANIRKKMNLTDRSISIKECLSKF